VHRSSYEVSFPGAKFATGKTGPELSRISATVNQSLTHGQKKGTLSSYYVRKKKERTFFLYYHYNIIQICNSVVWD
jgi:hypothetical protein